MRPEFFLYKERNNFKITNFQNGANVVPAVRIGYLSKTLGPTLGVQGRRRALARCTGDFSSSTAFTSDHADPVRLTTKGVQVALLFLFFRKRLCGPIANSCFHRRSDPHHRPNSQLEAAYHRADKAIQKIVDVLAAA
jgi:hypothetical protein